MLVTSFPSRGRVERGFTIIELLVTLVIVSIGMLGVAKMQAAAVAETGVARTRSLMTFQAEALAAMMRSNKAFWQSSTAFTQNITIPAGTSTTPQGATGLVQPSTTDHTCNSPATACTAANLAYDDLYTWKANFSKAFPLATGTIACTGSATTPETCDITLNWSERTVAVNRTTAAGTSTANASMILHVQP
jgi:type IV pilus assembly protein PilV